MNKEIENWIREFIGKTTIPIHWDRYTEYDTNGGKEFVINLFGWIPNPIQWIRVDTRLIDFVLIRFFGTYGPPLEMGMEYTTSSAKYTKQIGEDLGFNDIIDIHASCHKWKLKGEK